MKTKTSILLSLLLTATMAPAYGMDEKEMDEGRKTLKVLSEDPNTQLLKQINDRLRLSHCEENYMRGLKFLNGEGVPKNSCEAVRYFHLAAKDEHVGAQFQLGLACESGIGTLENPEESVKWYNLSAGQGNAAAEYRLAGGYMKGNGVSQNKKEGLQHYQKAAELGYAPAQNLVGTLYIKGEEFPKDEVKGVMWLIRADKQGDTTATFNLAAHYQSTGNKNESMKWYRKAIKSGNEIAQQTFKYHGGVLQLGPGQTSRNPKPASQFFKGEVIDISHM